MALPLRFFARKAWTRILSILLAMSVLLVVFVPASPAQSAREQNVLVIGASVTSGWFDDKQDGGYIKRTFSQTPYDVINKAIPGEKMSGIRSSYLKWLREYDPSYVIIAWGLLNDLRAHTSVRSVGRELQWEIQGAINSHATVIVVTPLVSMASLTTYKNVQPRYVQEEQKVAAHFLPATTSRNVHYIDLFSQMKRYIAAHRLNYRQYSYNAWHPNCKGHALAAGLFEKDLQPILPVMKQKLRMMPQQPELMLQRPQHTHTSPHTKKPLI